MNNKYKYAFFTILLFLLSLLNHTIYAQTRILGPLTISGSTSVNYGDKAIYQLENLSNPSEYEIWWYADGTIIAPQDTHNQSEIEVQWDAAGTKKITILYDGNYDSNFYYAELAVNVQSAPAVPEPPVVLNNNCTQVVLQRGSPPMSDIVWYWQSSSGGNSTANSNPTITLTSGREYFLRARRSNGEWSTASSSVPYSIQPNTPTVGTITQPTTTVTTGSVVLSNLPLDGVWTINPGGHQGYGENTTVTGLAASATYNFTVTNYGGCTSAPSANVIITGTPSDQLPTPTIGPITQPTCANNYASFQISNYNPAYAYAATPSTGVNFSGNTVTIQGGSAANYTIKASSSSNNSYASEPIFINQGRSTPNPPTIGSITQPSASATGSVTLSNLPNDGPWFINPGNISGQGPTIVLNGLAGSAQPYNFTVTNSSGCTSNASANVTINGFCGISDENYVNTIVPTVESTDAGTLASNQKNESITYYDGLGRPMQKVDIRAGEAVNPINNTIVFSDIITHIEYDQFGRQTKEYLPYTDTFNCGAFRGTALINSTIEKYYNTAKYGNTLNPYSEKELEPSPLNRVLKQAAPGNDWKLGNGHEIKMEYQTNIANDVKNFSFNLTYVNNTYTPTVPDVGYYSARELYKNVTFDENTTAVPLEADGSTVEFKNKQGQVILKRTYGTSIVNGVSQNKAAHDTYYVYDDYGNLTFVIPPKASDLATAGTTILASTLNDLCYQYKYDNRNRLVEKKLPGKQWEFIVYDKLDRPVATGPVLSPFNDTAVNAVGWMITKYDVFNRPMYTGWEQSTTVTSAGRITKQGAFDSATVLNESKTTTGTIDGVAVYYTNTVAPTIFKLLSVNYYDNYTFPGVPAIPTTVETQTVLASAELKGLPTGSWTRVATTLSATLGETVATFYDKKARPVRSHIKNHLGGETYTDSKLDFTGKPEYTIAYHKRLSGSTVLTTKDTFTYSPQGRLLTHIHKINSGAEQLIASNTYDELGQLISKKTGNAPTATAPLQKADYAYNIRGWMTEINKTASLTQSGDPKDLFAFRINYNTTNTGITGVNALYNGNIAETHWNTADVVRAYGYKYDNLNRLRDAIYQKASVLNAYNESLTYDKNGNIMSLLRNGTSETATAIDNLVYSYGTTNSTNQLTKVADSSSKTLGFVDSAANTVDDYSYDANGNMTVDKNKNITAIVYNQLNLPTKITFGTTGNIAYIYNATGQKVQKIVTVVSPASTTTTDYLGGYQYLNTALQFFPTAEGYVEAVTASSFKYVFQYKDHLGNIRLSYKDNDANGTIVTTEILEQNDYYAFGLKHTGYGPGIQSTNQALKYKYNGKELQDELGLNMYDYGARNYDPALGRWMNIDPKAENSRRWTPYNYAYNNPISFIDPDGMQALWVPSVNGNMIAEKGDNAKTLSKQLNISEKKAQQMINSQGLSKDSNGNVKAGEKVSINNNYSRALTKSNNEKGVTTKEIQNEGLGLGDTYERSNKKTDAYNCTDGAICGVKGVEITPENGDKYGKDQLSFSSMLKDESQFTEVGQSEAKFGQTIYSFNNEQGTHAAVYYGTSKDGTVFVFSKNGEYAKPAIMPLKAVQEIYGKPSAMYNPVNKI